MGVENELKAVQAQCNSQKDVIKTLDSKFFLLAKKSWRAEECDATCRGQFTKKNKGTKATGSDDFGKESEWIIGSRQKKTYLNIIVTISYILVITLSS